MARLETKRQKKSKRNKRSPATFLKGEVRMLQRIIKATRVVLGCSLVLAITAAAGQNPPTVSAQANTVYVSAEGTYEAAPDTAVVQFNVAAQGDTAKAAYDRASQAAE